MLPVTTAVHTLQGLPFLRHLSTVPVSLHFLVATWNLFNSFIVSVDTNFKVKWQRKYIALFTV